MKSKKELRKYIKELKHSMPDDLRQKESLSICEAILADEHIGSTQCVMAYYPLPDEPDIVPAITELYRRGKHVLLPAVAGENIELREFNAKGKLDEGAYHILEPRQHSALSPHNIDVVLVPGVAFTADGKRLGRGKGYYDRFLPQTLNAWKIGIAFPFQLVDEIETDAYDCPVDQVIV